MTWRPDLPGILGEIAEHVSEEAAVLLSRQMGGQELRIPDKARGSTLAKVVGDDAAGRIIDLLGPGRIRVPMGGYRGQEDKRRRGMALLQDGWSAAKVARHLDVHTRTAEYWKSALRRVKSQPDLFDHRD